MVTTLGTQCQVDRLSTTGTKGFGRLYSQKAEESTGSALTVLNDTCLPFKCPRGLGGSVQGL